MKFTKFIIIFILIIFVTSCNQTKVSFEDQAFDQALQNGILANEGYVRCQNFVKGWMEQADPKTGLIPRNLRESGKDLWEPKDSGADNYPFMVLTAAVLDRPLFEGKMFELLQTETKLTSRIGQMPDTYSFSKQDFNYPELDLNRIIFGASEYIKDGLLPLTEWLGASPWSERMISILNSIWENAQIETKYGNIPSKNVEVNGEMLQTLSRIYWMTGEDKYLQWAVRLGDFYMLGDQHPTKNFTSLRLRDHGCEIVSGLCELYAAVHFAIPEKKQVYQKPIYEMLDRILEVGRNEHGLFYNVINPQTGEIINNGVADTWGYTLNGFYTIYLLEKKEEYQQALFRAFGTLNKNYKNYRWEGESSDGYADAIESAINLLNREYSVSVAEWIDSETKVMWAKQRSDGIIEGWHGDGNFARTTIMYCLWKTQGITIQPWRSDIIFGAVSDKDRLKINLKSEREWQGKILFDTPRHRTNMKLPIDWPRINQFPEWFTVEVDKEYEMQNLTAKTKNRITGKELLEGIELTLEPNVEVKLFTK